jgi:hypothetical protein
VTPNPERPSRGEILDPAAFGRPSADTIIRRFTSPAERDADLAGKTPDELMGQAVSLRSPNAGVHTLAMHEGIAANPWRGCRAGGYAAARFTPRTYAAGEAVVESLYVEMASAPGASFPVGAMTIWAVGTNFAGPRIVVPGRYQIDVAMGIWRLQNSAPIAHARVAVFAGPDPRFPGLLRFVGNGSSGSPDSPDYAWSRRSTLSVVTDLDYDECVIVRLPCDPAAAAGGLVQPAPNPATPGLALGTFSVELLAPA